jgi:hypothetical protein
VLIEFHALTLVAVQANVPYWVQVLITRYYRALAMFRGILIRHENSSYLTNLPSVDITCEDGSSMLYLKDPLMAVENLDKPA